MPISGCRDHSEYSDCTAATGCTVWARRKVAGATSDRPMAADQTLLDEAHERLHHLFDGARGFAAVDIEEFHPVATQTGERPLQRASQRPGIVPEMALGFGVDARLGGDAHLGPGLGEIPADDRLGQAPPVDLGHVPVIHAKRQRLGHAGEALFLVRGAVDPAETHAAKADSTHAPPRQIAFQSHGKAAARAISTMSEKLDCRSSDAMASPVSKWSISFRTASARAPLRAATV